MVRKRKQAAEALQDLIDVIHFTESVSTRIHGLANKTQIFRTVREEFVKSGKYTASILLLGGDGSKLTIVATSLPSRKLMVGEKACGLRLKKYEIDLEKSKIYRRVVREGKTVQVGVDEIIGELFPRRMARLISRVMGYRDRKTIIVPLKLDGKIIGALATTSTDLTEYFIPSVKNLARHISAALELAHECAKRREAERALRIKDFAIASAINGVAVNDLEGRYIYVNQAFVEMVGCESENELLGKTLLEFVPDQCRGRVLKTMKEVKNKGSWLGELTAKRKDGSLFYIQICANLVKDETGKPLCTMASFVDITERKKAEEALRQLVESQKEFITTIGHELRTPLSVIKAAAEAELSKEDAPVSEQLILVNKKVDQITRILRDLMLISSLDIGQEQVEKTRFKLRGLIDEVLMDVGKRAERQQITPKVKKIYCPAATLLNGDRTKISRVLMNLLWNAMAHSAGKPKILLQVTKSRRGLKILIEDDNQPIPKEELGKIFEKFYRSKSARGSVGLGLGLYISEKLVKLMGGKIWAENKKRGGNRFVVQLPIS